MLKLEIKELLVTKGYKPGIRLLMRIGIAHRAAGRILRGETKSISHKHMELLCIFLNCTPNDLYNFVPDSERQVAPGHMLMSIRKRKAVYDPAEYIKLLRPEQIEAANELLKKMVDTNSPAV